MKRFSIEGEAFSHEAVLMANKETFTHKDIRDLDQLKVGDGLYFGFIEITRIRNWTPNGCQTSNKGEVACK